MYNFRDVNEALMDTALPSEALQINGEHIEKLITGYRTLYVSGREALAPELSTFETGIRDGSRLASKRYPARTLVVGYQIIADSNQAFREAYNTLGDILDVEEAMLVFHDEEDKFFIGTPSALGEVEPGCNAITSEFEILCVDPFKYSIEEYEAEPISMDGMYTVSDDFGGDAMSVTPAGIHSGFAVGQQLNNTVADGTVTLVGEGSDAYVFGVDYVLDSATGIVYVTAELAEDSMDSWKYNTLDTLSGQKVATFLIDYNGTYRSFPVLEASFPEGTEDDDGQISNDACGFVAYLNEDKKIIQLGDPEEQDEGVVSSTASTSFYSNWHSNSGTGGWKTNNGVLSWLSKATGSMGRATWAGAAATHGKSSVGSLKLLRPSSYGSGASKTWFGPTITRTIPKDKAQNLGARNFTCTWNQIMAMGTGKDYTKQLGRFCCWLVQNTNGVRKVIAGVAISKGGVGKSANVYFIVNGKTISGITTSINLERYNSRFGFIKKVTTKVKVKLTKKERKKKKYQGKKYKYKTKISFYNTKPIRTSSITKNGAKITFNIAGIKHTYEDSAIRDLEANEVTFNFGRYHNNPALSYNALCWAKFVNAAYETTADIENTFSAGDELVADCEDGSIYLNNLERPDLGALGNDWEDFYLDQGVNQIGATWSDWASGDPTFKLRYREVFL